MDAQMDDIGSLLPLTPAVYAILLALAGGEKHGYAIMREAERATDGQTRLAPGTLYRSIKQMLALSMIEESDERPDPELDDERRRYYRLTGYGRRVAEAESQRLARLVAEAQARKLLGGNPAPGIQGIQGGLG